MIVWGSGFRLSAVLGCRILCSRSSAILGFRDQENIA